jgi:protein-S-isoprenylcysteine O-methyltransferase Ste14
VTTVLLGALTVAGWASLELIFRRPGAAATLAAEPDDRRTTATLVAAYGLAVVLPIGLAVTGVGVIGDMAWIGVGLGLVGLVLRAWAMATLGTSYTRTLRTADHQVLVTSGPYRWVRHPGYAASLAVWVGAALAFHSWIAAVVVAMLLGLAYGWRIRSEERMLIGTFGDAYRAYAARTARLVPWLLLVGLAG